MRRVIAALLALGIVATGGTVLRRPRIQVLYAQVPATLHAKWDPNPATDNVVDYQLTIDAAAPVTVPLTACSATVCDTTFVITAYGIHTAKVAARNLSLDTDPTSFQISATRDVTFRLSAPPNQPANGRVTR